MRIRMNRPGDDWAAVCAGDSFRWLAVLLQHPAYPGAGVPRDRSRGAYGALAGGYDLGTSPGIIGIILAYIVYVANRGWPDSIKNSFSGVYNLLLNKYFVDEVYDATIITPIEKTSRSFPVEGCGRGHYR